MNDLRVAWISAAAALLGALIGAGTAAVTTHAMTTAQEQERIREGRTAAHAALLECLVDRDWLSTDQALMKRYALAYSRSVLMAGPDTAPLIGQMHLAITFLGDLENLKSESDPWTLSIERLRTSTQSSRDALGAATVDNAKLVEAQLTDVLNGLPPNQTGRESKAARHVARLCQSALVSAMRTELATESPAGR